jgi:hypothetical protein
MSRYKDYNYDDITMMYIPEEDRRFLPHLAGGTLPIVYPFQPVAKRTRSQVAKLKQHIRFHKYGLPALRLLQEADRAERRRQEADRAERPRVCTISTTACLLLPVPARPRTFANRLERRP